MPRRATPLTAEQVRTLGPAIGKNGRPIPKLHSDGHGLGLLVKAGGTRSWVFRYFMDGERRDLGLGPAGYGPHEISLKDARIAAGEAARLIRAGINPSERRACEKAARLAVIAERKAHRPVIETFRKLAADYIATKEAEWKNVKHRLIWESTLRTYAFPKFGDKAIALIDTPDVLSAIEPIWLTKNETASRLRGRIEAILDYSKTKALRSGENPARWDGHLEYTLGKRSKIAPVVHHPALAWQAMHGFMLDLRQRDTCAALALEFAILTGTRTGETLGARWNEIDHSDDHPAWMIPESRMKMAKGHLVPLSTGALDVLSLAADLRTSEAADAFIFPGQRDGRPLSNMALLSVLKRMERGDITPHGFRATFRTWASEATTVQSEVAEMALAHAIKDKTEASYQRGTMFDKRADLMQMWAEFCAAPYVKPSKAARSESPAG